MTLHITDYGSISNTNMTEVYLTEDNPASGIQEVDTQEDPLADTTADWQICDQVNVKNQLVNLDNSAQHQISEAFSIVNLEKIKMEEQVIKYCLSDLSRIINKSRSVSNES